MISNETAPTDQACIRIANSRYELAQAFSLVYRNYLEAGLIEPNAAEGRVIRQHTLATTEVFVAKTRSEVFGTATLVRDSALGLPMESIYAREVESRRDQNLSLAEVSCLADRRSRLSPRSLIDLMAFTIQCAERRGVDHMLIAVHPRHVRFYSKYLGFYVFGGFRAYGAVRGNPAVGLCLDLNTFEERSPTAYQRVFDHRHWSTELDEQPRSQAVRRYIEQLLAITELASAYSSQCAGMA